jgi:tetratricopeptide (TPR) repeat protein
MYLALAARMRGRVEQTRSYTASLATVAEAAEMLEYIAAASANEAWLALRGGDREVAVACARRALELWKERVFPFQWLGLLPLMEAELERANIEQAVSCAEELLAPSQQYLPGAAADALARAVGLFRSGQTSAAQTALGLALRDLARTGHR